MIVLERNHTMVLDIYKKLILSLLKIRIKLIQITYCIYLNLWYVVVMREKRDLERYNLTIPARLEVSVNNNKREVIELQALNVCSGGAFLQTTHSISEGAQVKLDFVLPFEKIKELIGTYGCVKVSGRVVRSEPNGIAVSFDKKYEILPYRNS